MSSFDEVTSNDDVKLVGLQDGNNILLSTDNLLSDLNSRVTAVETAVETVVDTTSYYVGQWEDGTSSPTAVNLLGNETVIDVWRPALVDCTDNSGDTTTFHELNRLNWLRYKDGSYAPAIAITEDEYTACDVELYLDSECSEKYCDAGDFDAEKFYNEYGYYTSLYDSNGIEISHIRRPWETTSTDYTHVIANKVPLWLLDQQVSEENNAYNNKGISNVAGQYDGFNFSGYKLPVTGIFASPFTTIGNKARSFFYDYCTGETNCQGGAGYGSCCTMFYQDGTHPRVSNITQITSMTYGRANNNDTSLSYPFAEGGDFAHNVFCSCLELMAGTKYLHNNTLFGSGISSDNTCNSESTWLANGGFRYKTSDSDSYSYCTFGSTPTLYYDANSSTAAATYILNTRYPLAQCEEGQIAFSLMQELGIAEDEEFEWNNGTWWWQSVTGCYTVADGHMNVRVYKKVEDTISAYDADGNEQDYDIGVVLRFSLYEGLDLCGDILGYCGGGLEMVGLGTGSGYTGRDETVDIYIEPDQTKWHSETTVSKASQGTFDFESSYTKIASDITIVGDHWAKDRISYSPWSPTSGGSTSTYECFYHWQNPYWDSVSGTRYRLAARRRGIAPDSYCTPRHLRSLHAVSYANVSSGGFAQCLGTWE